VEVKDPQGVYEVNKMGQTHEPEDWSEEKTRNETDIITTRVTRRIEQQQQADPYAQDPFSKRLRQALQQPTKLFDHPLQQYMLFHEFEEQVQKRRLDDIPNAFEGTHHAQAYFGVFKKVLPEALAVMDHQVQDKWVKLAFELDQVV